MVLLARSACSCVHVGKQQKLHEASDLAFLFLEQGHPPKLVMQAFAVARQPLLATSVLPDPARWQGQAQRAQAHHLKVSAAGCVQTLCLHHLRRWLRSHTGATLLGMTIADLAQLSAAAAAAAAVQNTWDGMQTCQLGCH